MKTLKAGQIVRFHTPLPDEDPTQIYVIVEISDDETSNRAAIKPLNFNFQFPPVLTVKSSHLEEVRVSATEMIGETVSLIKRDGSEVNGRVISAKDKEIFLEMSRDERKVITNCQLTIIDKSGIQHDGFYVFGT
ncbi:MAG: hypothetical protein LCH52_02360 [Bacteroidetes bacterium]|nr:hypothetical protein [Bacteroidota bacterium]